jgi:hypothetical protein
VAGSVEEHEDAEPATARSTADLATWRSRVASFVWLVAVLVALVLALSVLLVALKLDDSGAVKAIRDLAANIDFGTLFKVDGSGVEGSNAAVRFALLNQGAAAVIWLVLGKVLDKIIRP